MPPKSDDHALNDAPATSADFRITLQLGNKPDSLVTLSASDFGKIAKKGLHFELPAGTKVEIGTLKEMIEWVNAKLKTDIPSEVDGDWPDDLKKIFNGILNVETSISELTIDQNPKAEGETAYPPMEFSLAVDAIAVNAQKVPTPIPFLGLFSVVGGGLEVSRRTKAVKSRAIEDVSYEEIEDNKEIEGKPKKAIGK